MNNTIDALKSLLESYPQETLSRNKLLPIMYNVLGDRQLEKDYKISAVRSFLYEHEIRKIFNQFNTMGIRAILLKGLYLGFKIYKDPALRPFTDIDVLVEKHDIEKAKNALKKLGYYYSPSLFPEDFFLESHLHLVYFQHKHGIPCEVHWAIDHPFSHYDIKMDEIFKTAIPIKLEGIQCFDIKPELRFILLLIHIQRHLPYLKYQYSKPNLREQIIENGELLHILDAYLFLKRHENNFDWSVFADKSIHWNVDGVMYSTLKTVGKIFYPSIPTDIFKKLSPPAKRPLEEFLTRNVFKAVGSTRLISKITKKLIFSPKRLPDLYTWFFPDKKTIVRKYYNKPIFCSYIKNFSRCFSKILNLIKICAAKQLH